MNLLYSCSLIIVELLFYFFLLYSQTLINTPYIYKVYISILSSHKQSMSTKTKFTKKSMLFVIFFLIWIGLYSVINSWNLRFTNLKQDTLTAKFSQIHFTSSGNDFGGGVFWLGSQTYNTPISINFWSESKKCTKKLRGIYYNDARWARLWPLDQETLSLLTTSDASYAWLTVTGGLYTACQWNDSKYGIFGYIKYELAGTPKTTSYIIAWAGLNFGTNGYLATGAKNNFQYFNNETPIGFIRDSVGWIWFVGGAVTGTQDLLNYLNGTGTINNAFTLGSGVTSITSSWWLSSGTTGNAEDTMWNLLIQGNAILSKAVSIYEKKALLGNLEKRTVLLSSSDINSSTVINTAKKNAEALCRGNAYKVEYSNKQILNSSVPGSILCYKDSSDLFIQLNGNSSYYAGKTIVLKNGNLTLKGSMDTDYPPLDIFIDWGNLYIENTSGLGNLTKFNIQGFPVSTATGINQGKFLRGNFIINGLLLGGTVWSPTTINNKLHIQGKFVSLNTPSEPSQWRIDQVNDLLGTSPSYASRIGLESLLSWYCNLNSDGSDWSSCWDSALITSTPFVILDGTYPSQIIK